MLHFSFFDSCPIQNENSVIPIDVSVLSYLLAAVYDCRTSHIIVLIMIVELAISLYLQCGGTTGSKCHVTKMNILTCTSPSFTPPNQSIRDSILKTHARPCREAR